MQGHSFGTAALSGLGYCHLSGLVMTTPSSGPGEIRPSMSHHIVELEVRCASRADRRRLPTGHATMFKLPSQSQSISSFGSLLCGPPARPVRLDRPGHPRQLVGNSDRHDVERSSGQEGIDPIPHAASSPDAIRTSARAPLMN